MASAAPSGDGGGDDKPPESAPANLASPDPPADPQRNGEPPVPVPVPVPSSGDDDMSTMGMMVIPDLARVASSGDDDVSSMGMMQIPDPAPAECGAKRSRPPPCPRCARRKMILRGLDPGPLSDDELPALPASPVPGTGMALPDPQALGTNGSPSAAGRCSLCEFRKKIHRNRRPRRNSGVPAPPPGPPPFPFMPIPPLDDQWPLALEQNMQQRARRGKKRPLSVEEDRGYRECDVGKKLMRHKWDGLHHKWAGLRRDSVLEVPGFDETDEERYLREKMMVGTKKMLLAQQRAAKPGFGAAAGGRDLVEEMGFGAAAGGGDLLEKMMLVMRKALQVDDARLALQQEAQKPSPSAAARVDVLHQKLAQMTKVLTKVLHEGGVLQVSTKLMGLLCPGSSAAAVGGLDGSDWGLVEQTINNLVNQTGEGMQDIVKTVIAKVFSKEILYDLIMACVGRYPKLLEDDKGKLTREKYKQYQKQLDLMVNLTMAYDNDPDNFSKIMKLMCKIGECGPLPREVIDGISPGLDPSTMEQLYTGMLELLHSVD